MTQECGIAHDYELEVTGYPAPLCIALTIMVASLTEVAAFADGGKAADSRALFTCHLMGRIVRENNGSLLQSPAGCVTACFHLAQDAVRAAIRIQTSVDEGNFRNTSSGPVLVSIGLHTGQGSAGQLNSERDVASVAQYCDSIAHGGEIVLTEQTRDGLPDGAGIHALFMKAVTLRQSPPQIFNLYNAIWKATEVEVDVSSSRNPGGGEVKGTLLPAGRRLAIGLLSILVCYLVIKAPDALKRFSAEKERLIYQRVDLPTGQDR